MRITPSGYLVGGVAGSGVFVDGVMLRPGPAGTATAGGERVYYQSAVAALHSCAVDGSDLRGENCPPGITMVVASSSVWAAWTTGHMAMTSWGVGYPGWVPMLATDDGAVLLMSYPEPHGGLRMVDASGDVWREASAGQMFYPYPQAFALDRNRVVWTEPGGRVRVRGLAEPAQLGSIFDPFLIEGPGGRVWIGYHTDRAVMHPLEDASHGYVLATGDTFGTTATGNRVGWSRDASESRMESVEVDWSAPLVSLAPTMPTVVVDRFTRPCWLLPFHATRHNMSVVSPGHGEIITDGQDAERRVARRPVVSDMRSEPTVDDLLALFAVIGVDDMTEARAVADRRGVPIMAYWDHVTRIPDVPELVQGWDWLSVMLYCDPAESMDAFRRRAENQVAEAAWRGYRVVLTVQMFDRNGTETNTTKLSALQAIWRELAEAYPDVIGIAPFAVLRAAHGVTAYPFLSEWLAAYGAAMTAPARPVRGVVPVIPPVTGGSMRPSDDEIKAEMREAKAHYERQGVRFKSVAQAQANDYAGFTYSDKRKSALPTSRAALRLAAKHPRAGIGLESYSGASGVPIDGGEHYSYQMWILRDGPISNQVMRSGVEPDSSWHEPTPAHDAARLLADWRPPVSVEQAPADLISPIPPVPAASAPEVMPRLDLATATRDQLRKWRGSIAMTTYNGDAKFFTAMFDNTRYTAADRAAMLANYPYTHLAMGPLIQGGYHAYGWDRTNFMDRPDVFLDRAQEVADAGKVPCVFLLPDTGDYADGKTIDRVAVERDLTPLYSGERWQKLCRVVVLAWEPDYTFADTVWGAQWMARVFPNAVRYIHLPSEQEGPGVDVTNLRAAWADIAPSIHGVMFQATYTWLGDVPTALTPEEQTRQYAAAMVTLLDGLNLDTVIFEWSSYGLYGGFPARWTTEAEIRAASIEMGRQLLSIPGVMGVGDSCPVVGASGPVTPPVTGADAYRVAAHQAATAAVTAAYQEILGRAPDAGGLASYVTQVLAGLTIADMRNALSKANEER